LQNPSPGFSALLQPLLTPKTIPETLLVILLDWSEPWNWVRQIRDWIRLLHGALSALDDNSKEVMQEIMQDWEQQRRGGAYDMGGANISPESNVAVPLGPGEWDEALGLPLCVVCHNVRILLAYCIPTKLP
jgi:dynein light intermediate chain 1, cytosolic